MFSLTTNSRLSRLFSLEKIPAVLTLHFLAHGVFVICVAFANAVFLTTYPASWLPYWFITQAVFDCVIIFATAPLLSSTSKNTFLYAHLAIATIVLLTFCLMGFHWFLTPFIFALLLSTSTQIINAIAWNKASVSFDIIEFKKVSAWVVSAGIVGEIFFSVLIFIFVKLFGANVLIYFLITTILLGMICLNPLQPLPIAIKKFKHGDDPFKYSLYQKIFISTFLVGVSYTFIDFIFKRKLGATFDAAQISTFISALMAISNVIALLLSLLGIKWILNRLGSTTLMAILPLYWLIGGIIVFFFPSLWSIAILAAARYIIFQGMFVMGREVTVNVLPRQIRGLGQLRLRSIAGPVSLGSSALLLFLLKDQLNIVYIASFLIVLNLFLFIYIKRIDKSYVATLKEEAQSKRFNMGLDLNKHNIEVIKDIVLNAIASADMNFVRFGFSLLPNVTLDTLPPQMPKLLDANDADIRLNAVKCIIQCNAINMAPTLLEHLKLETDPEVRWFIFNAVATLNPEQGIEIARAYLADPAAENRGGALRILFAAGNIDDELHALTILKEMIYDPSVAMRKFGARVLGYLHVGHFQDELTKLISDDDDIVSNKAIDAAARQMMIELASVIIARLSKGRVFYSAQKALEKLGAQSTPLIMQSINNYKDKPDTNLDALIRMLATIPTLDVESHFITLAQDSHPYICNAAAKEMAYRACHIEVSSEFKKHAKQFALNEAKLISFLQFLQTQYQANFIIAELESRKHLATKRYLYWLAVDANAKEIISLMPAILTGIKFERSKALELLNSLVNQRDLTETTIALFSEKNMPVPQNMLSSQDSYLDAWLKKVIHFKPEPTREGIMQNMQKVFVLRAVELFSSLPSETLLVIAEEAEALDMHEGQAIFMENDPPTGLFIIVSGQVDIVKKGQVINELKENAFFGELALIDQAGRSASAIAKTEGTLLYLDKETFDRITDDLPDVLRAVVRVILRYLRGYLA